MPDNQQFTADLNWAADRLRTEHGEYSAAERLEQWAAGQDSPPFSLAPKTGPEHYREAERRLLMAWEDDREDENVRHLVAEAQVHAALALAAATALAASAAGHMPLADYNSWHATASTPDARSSAYEEAGA